MKYPVLFLALIAMAELHFKMEKMCSNSSWIQDLDFLIWL